VRPITTGLKVEKSFPNFRVALNNTWSDVWSSGIVDISQDKKIPLIVRARTGNEKSLEDIEDPSLVNAQDRKNLYANLFTYMIEENFSRKSLKDIESGEGENFIDKRFNDLKIHGSWIMSNFKSGLKEFVCKLSMIFSRILSDVLLTIKRHLPLIYNKYYDENLKDVEVIEIVLGRPFFMTISTLGYALSPTFDEDELREQLDRIGVYGRTLDTQRMKMEGEYPDDEGYSRILKKKVMRFTTKMDKFNTIVDMEKSEEDIFKLSYWATIVVHEFFHEFLGDYWKSQQKIYTEGLVEYLLYLVADLRINRDKIEDEFMRKIYSGILSFKKLFSGYKDIHSYWDSWDRIQPYYAIGVLELGPKYFNLVATQTQKIRALIPIRKKRIDGTIYIDTDETWIVAPIYENKLPSGIKSINFLTSGEKFQDIISFLPKFIDNFISNSKILSKSLKDQLREYSDSELKTSALYMKVRDKQKRGKKISEVADGSLRDLSYGLSVGEVGYTYIRGSTSKYIKLKKMKVLYDSFIKPIKASIDSIRDYGNFEMIPPDVVNSLRYDLIKQRDGFLYYIFSNVNWKGDMVDNINYVKLLSSLDIIMNINDGSNLENIINGYVGAITFYFNCRMERDEHDIGR